MGDTGKATTDSMTSPSRATGADAIRPGQAFPTARIAVSPERQRMMHACCGIPPERWGDRVDPGLLAHEPFRLMGRRVSTCRPGWGYVGMGHRIRMRAPVRLGEPLEMSGTVTGVEPIARGTILRASFAFAPPGGACRLLIEPEALMLDPARTARPEGGRAPADDAAGFEPVAMKVMTPEAVRGYCVDNENHAHTDPDHARRLGFRAPIAAGNQLVNFHLDALALLLGRPPEALDVEIRFRRPVFWDETLTVEARRDEDGLPSALRLCNGAGKVASTCAVRALR